MVIKGWFLIKSWFLIVAPPIAGFFWGACAALDALGLQ